MASSVALRLKQALVEELGKVSALSGVSISYALPADRLHTELVWLGDFSSRHEPEVMKAGRVLRMEEAELELHIWVSSMARPESAEERAADLGQAVEEMLADDPKVGGVDGLLWCYVSGYSLTTDMTAERPHAELSLTLTCRGRLL